MKVVGRVRRFGGEYAPPGDKSITHRSFLAGALASGETTVRGHLACGDTLHLLGALRRLGVKVTREGEGLRLASPGLDGLTEPETVLNMGNSGTAMRLLAGVLASRPGLAILTGDASLRSRPMERVAKPLRLMGAKLHLRSGGKAPVAIVGGALRGVRYAMPVASAQVKSCLLLAGLGAEGITEVVEPAVSRDHTERLLTALGVKVGRDGGVVSVEGGQRPFAADLTVPGDLSSAAFMIAACLLVGGGSLRVAGVGLNPGRTGLLEALRKMGAKLTVSGRRTVGGEIVGDIEVAPGPLAGIALPEHLVPAMIDEFPIFALLAALAEGETRITGAAELRHKESDRIALVAGGLSRLGADVTELPDGMIIRGPAKLAGCRLSSAGDHRLAMTWAVAGLVASTPVQISGAEAVATSYPGFFSDLARLSGGKVRGGGVS